MTTLQVSATHLEIIRYYEEAGLDYGAWSPAFNMHFGYWRPGMNPFRLEPMLEQMNEEVFRRLQLPPGSEPLVLDAGCGLSAASRHLAKALPGAQFYGVTITPWQIDFGEKLNAEAGLSDRIRLLEADFHDLPLPDACADAAFCLESACYGDGDGKERLVREIARVLKPGARFVVADGFRNHPNPLPHWLDRIYRRAMDCWALQDFAEIHSFEKSLKKAGFTDIRVEDILWQLAPSVAHVPKTALKFFWRRLWETDRKPLTQERLNNTIAPLLSMAMGLARKHFSYRIVSAVRDE